MTTIDELYCRCCKSSYDPGEIRTFCVDCQSPLFARYDLDRASKLLSRDIIIRRPRGMWRWKELLPVIDEEHMLTLGEGDTPLLKMHRLSEKLGVSNLYVKDESINPTGTFKARGLAVAISKAREFGVQKVIIPTAGNAGGAMAAYSARGGMRSCVYMPKDTPIANIEEARIFGAEVILVDGLINDAAKLAADRARKEGWFDVSTFKEPYRTEGKKVMGYELAEQFNWLLPDVIIYPTGGGTGLVGMWKAFGELKEIGWLDSEKRPRMVAVQAAGCAPVVKAYETNMARSEFWKNAQTIASGLRVPKSFADRAILEDIRDSNGIAVAVSDAEIRAAQKLLGELEGIFAAPEGAATLAGLVELIRRGWLDPDEQIVLFNTGTGLKYPIRLPDL